MSAAKKITNADIAEAKSLDWKARPQDFDKLCEFVITLLSERDGVTRERLFALLPEPDFRREVRHSLERRKEQGFSLAAYAYTRVKFIVLPDATRKRKGSP